MPNEESIYIITINFKSSLFFRTNIPTKVLVHPEVKELKLASKTSQNGNWLIESNLQIKFTSKENEYIKKAEEIVNTIFGFFSLVFNENLSYEQIEIFNDKGKGIILIEKPLMFSKREINTLYFPLKFDKKHQLALFWIGKAISAVRPDDKFVFYCTAIESLLPKEMRKDIKTCTTCNRPFASYPIQNILIEKCNVPVKEAIKITKYRNKLLHGSTSAIIEYEEFLNLADKMISALQTYFNITFGLNIRKPDLLIANKMQICMEQVNNTH